MRDPRRPRLVTHHSCVIFQFLTAQNHKQLCRFFPQRSSKKVSSSSFLFWTHFFFFLLFFREGDLERDLDRFFRDELFLEGEPLRDLERLRLCLLPGERLRDRDLARPRDELRLRDRDLDRLVFEGEGVRDS